MRVAASDRCSNPKKEMFKITRSLSARKAPGALRSVSRYKERRYTVKVWSSGRVTRVLAFGFVATLGQGVGVGQGVKDNDPVPN